MVEESEEKRKAYLEREEVSEYSYSKQKNGI